MSFQNYMLCSLRKAPGMLTDKSHKSKSILTDCKHEAITAKLGNHILHTFKWSWIIRLSEILLTCTWRVSLVEPLVRLDQTRSAMTFTFSCNMAKFFQAHFTFRTTTGSPPLQNGAELGPMEYWPLDSSNYLLQPYFWEMIFPVCRPSSSLLRNIVFRRHAVQIRM